MSDDTPPETGATPLSRLGSTAGVPASERRDRLAAVFHEARGCTRCPQLVAGRTQVVFGAGNADADLMFVGEAPGTREDEQGVPFVGAAGKLLDELLASIGLDRSAVFITSVLKCRPPGNRDPAPAEITRCRPYLHEQIALVEPRVVCTLGDFATKLLRDDASAGIKALRGRAEVATLGRRAVHLLPLYHPAAALYTRALRDQLEADVARLPELLARPAPPQPEMPETVREAGATTVLEATATEGRPEPSGSGGPDAPAAEPDDARDAPDDQPQLGLF